MRHLLRAASIFTLFATSSLALFTGPADATTGGSINSDYFSCAVVFDGNIISSATINALDTSVAPWGTLQATSTITCTWHGTAAIDDESLYYQIPYAGGFITGTMHTSSNNSALLQTSNTTTCDTTAIGYGTGSGHGQSAFAYPLAQGSCPQWSSGTTSPFNCSSLSFLYQPEVMAYQYHSGAFDCSALDSSSNYASTSWNGGTTFTPCTLINANDTVGAATEGTSYTFKFTFGGGATEVVSDPGETSIDGSTTIDGQTFSKKATVYPHPESPLTTTETAPSTGLFTPDTFCYDGTIWTHWFATGTGNPGPPTGGGPITDLQLCFGAGGMILNNPITWVVGAWKDGICIAQYLVVPTDSKVTALTNQFGFTSSGGTGSGCSTPANPGITTGSVSQWLGAGFTLLTTGPSCAFTTIQSEEAAGATSSVLSNSMTVTGGGHTMTASFPDAINKATANSDIANVVAFALLITTAALALMTFFLVKDLIEDIINTTK